LQFKTFEVGVFFSTPRDQRHFIWQKVLWSA